MNQIKQILLFFCLFAAVPTKTVAQNHVILRGYNFAPIENKINDWIKNGYYDGANIIVAKDNQVILKKSFGTYTPETEVYIASAGKWLAVATIAVIVDEGKLDWDDKAVKYIPEMTDAKGQATLRQLLSHTAGYPDYQPKGQHRDDYQTLAESVKNILPLPANTVEELNLDKIGKGGKLFQYGGLAMQVAGRMAEIATNKDWETLFQEKIAKPLGMKNTHFTPVDSIGGGHSPMLGGGARSTVADYANFLEMILNKGIFKGKRVLSKKVIEEMQADQVGKAQVNHGEYVEKARGKYRTDIYGLGEWREEVNNKGVATLVSSPSWAGAYPWIDKKNKVYGFFITHVNVEKANKDNFSAFYSSPVLPMMVREILKN